MPEETGFKWWMRYVIVPIIGGGGLIAIIVAIISSPSSVTTSSVQPITPLQEAHNVEENKPTITDEKAELGVELFGNKRFTGKVTIPNDKLDDQFRVYWSIPHPKGMVVLIQRTSGGQVSTTRFSENASAAGWGFVFVMRDNADGSTFTLQDNDQNVATLTVHVEE